MRTGYGKTVKVFQIEFYQLFHALYVTNVRVVITKNLSMIIVRNPDK